MYMLADLLIIPVFSPYAVFLIQSVGGRFGAIVKIRSEGCLVSAVTSSRFCWSSPLGFIWRSGKVFGKPESKAVGINVL